MAVTSDFDRFFLHLPPFDREKDFDDFWKRSISESKKIPVEPSYVPSGTKRPGFDVFTVSFKGYNRSGLKGTLYVPSKSKSPRVVILLPDYNTTSPYEQYTLETGLAYYFFHMRGHEYTNTTDGELESSPGFMVENINDPESYYLKAVYLDVLRVIDLLRLKGDLDCGSMGIIGKGTGAAAAVFAASFSTRVKALVLDTASFCYLPLSQNHSTSDTAREINQYIAAHRTRKNLVKKNLSYFDALNFSDMIGIPVLATVGLKDTLSPPQCVFALFNRLICDKTIEVYPDEGNEAGGAGQFAKNLGWIKRMLR